MGEQFTLKKESNWKAYPIILIVILLIIAIYFTFFYYYSCEDMACFKSHQEKCVKTKFVNNEEDIMWRYIIEGKEGNKCKINVDVLIVKEGSNDKQVLEGKSMDCFLPLGSIESPESDLGICTGGLKEEIQNIIIQKFHAYILDNIGQISQELEKAY